MQRILPCFLFLVFFSLSTYSQESILLQGQILTDLLEGTVNIVNMTRKTGAVNVLSGKFELEVFLNDTLYFSSVQYELKEVVIRKEIFKEKYLEVALVPNIHQLDEVKISNISLSGNIAKDLGNIKTFDQAEVGIPYSTKPRLTSVERKLYTASSSTLSLLINTLTGEIKMLKKAKANAQLDALVDKGLKAFPFSVFVDEFALPEEHVQNFVYYFAEDPNFKELVTKEEPLVLLEYYKGKVANFLRERIGK